MNIGQVFLDETYYPGEDLYSEGKGEEELLQIARNYREEEWNQVIAERGSWPVLYHFSHIRENIVNWIPFSGKEHVLEIGSGCGAITGALCRKAETVTCIELSKKRSEINAWRNRDYGNLTILLGNFQDVEKSLSEKYDYITLIGVLEYGGLYIQSEQPYEDFLKIVASHLKPDGKIIIAIENRFGLKYWSGCAEDHTGTLFEGLEGYTHTKGVRTFTKKELSNLFRKAGNMKADWYYPFPDYKLPNIIFSDDRLPAKGELNRSEYNYDRLKMTLFQESPVFDSLLENNLFPEFSNSFLVMVGKQDVQNQDEKKVIYTRFSNERDRRFSAMTSILKKSGKKIVERKALTELAAEHVEKCMQNEEQLHRVYAKEGLKVNHCLEKREKGTIRLEFLEGPTLEEVLDQKVLEGKIEEAEKLLLDMIEKIRKIHSTANFTQTREFQEIFGNPSLPEGIAGAENPNMDPVAGNMICNQEGIHLIDYEWVFPFMVPVHFLIYRMIYLYIYSDEKRSIFLNRNLYKKAGISEEELEIYREMEERFQKYILGKHVPMRDMYSMISPGKLDVRNMYTQSQNFPSMNKLQVFWEKDGKFSEENSFLVPLGQKDHIVRITLPEKTEFIRLDPGEHSGIFRIGKLKDTDSGVEISYSINGFLMDEGKVCFFHDPQIYSGKLPAGCLHLEIKLERIEDTLEEEVVTAAKEKIEAQQQELEELRNRLVKKEKLIHDMENTKVWKMYRKIKKK